MRRIALAAPVALLMIVCAVVGAGCATATVDRTQAQAQEGAPTAAEVPVLTIPYDPNLPRFVVAVDTLDYSASGQISGGGAPIQNADIGKGLSAQLITSLTKAGNISVVDWAGVTNKGDGTYTAKMQDGEVGLFILKGTVTEFNETADLSAKKRGGSLGRAGLLVGIAGAISGDRATTYTGAGIAAANPTMERGEMKRSGMVGMDLRLLDGRTGRVLGSYVCKGTFTTMSSSSGVSLFGIGGTNTEFAASALGQATRAAMNEALRQTFAGLRNAPR
ncbi:MAG: hypothetical protein GWP08_01030 [Nitrospiraceae bacterium]|nr:hypothetical protein [Nitrospiraceae bacterium]